MLRELEEEAADTTPGAGPSAEMVDGDFDEMVGGLIEVQDGLSAYLRHAGSAAATLADLDDAW